MFQKLLKYVKELIFFYRALKKVYLIYSLFQNRDKQMQGVQNAQKQKQKNCQFVDKLLDMMEKYPKQIFWAEDGQQLIINKEEQVETSVLPEYFRHQNFASFVRQLNMYGFCKKEKREEFLRFTHKIFKRGNQHNFYLIQRKAKTRNIKNSAQKFYESNSKIIQSIKTRSGLTDEAQDLTVTLLQHKQNMQDATRRIKYQLDKLFLQLKDTRSKQVLQTLDFIQKQSYPSILKSLTKAKSIDELLLEQLNLNSKSDTKKQQQNIFKDQQNDGEECSLEQHLENAEKCQSEAEASQRIQMEEDQLSGSNYFQEKL